MGNRGGGETGNAGPAAPARARPFFSPLIFAYCLLPIAYCLPSPAAAGEVSLSLESPATYEDTPVTATVEISDPAGDEEPPALPAAAGLEVKGPFGPLAVREVINGPASES